MSKSSKRESSIRQPDATRDEIGAITPDSLREFWRTHDQRWSGVDRGEDPSGLGIVCHAGAPLWVNRYAAACQERVFRRLLQEMSPVSRGSRALDVGCGTGRWSRTLNAAGYNVVGIDLQPGVLERNRAEIPGVQFVYSTIQDFRDKPFDLVTSVTVIQHNPPDEQRVIVRRLRELLCKGGHAIVMENTVDSLPHVFAPNESTWRLLFESNSFECLRTVRYDYRLAQRLARRRGAVASSTAPVTVSPGQSPVRNAIKRALVTLDRVIEAPLVRLGVRGSTHCGFIFRAV